MFGLEQEGMVVRRSRYPEKRVEVVKAIFSLSQELHRTPSVREISERTDVSLSTLHAYLEQLAEEGLIEWRPRRHRSLRLTPEGQRLATTGVPF